MTSIYSQAPCATHDGYNSLIYKAIILNVAQYVLCDIRLVRCVLRLFWPVLPCFEPDNGVSIADSILALFIRLILLLTF